MHFALMSNVESGFLAFFFLLFPGQTHIHTYFLQSYLNRVFTGSRTQNFLQIGGRLSLVVGNASEAFVDVYPKILRWVRSWLDWRAFMHVVVILVRE